MHPNFNHSPRSAHLIPSRPNTQFSNGLQLRDIKELPIIYPSPKSSYEARLADQQKELDDKYDEDDDDEWELEHEYIDVGTEEAAGNGMDPYLGAPTRPHQIRRESQDVEFGHRTPPSRRMRGRGRGWEVNVRIPRMKSLARGKTVFLKSIRGGLRRTHTTGHSPANGSPPFEFRDPQPAPQSIRQQYLELAPSDGSAAAVHEMRTENGLLAPPLEKGGSSSSTTDAREPVKAHEADVPSRHSRSQSMFSHSQSQAHSPSRQTLRAPSIHSRSRSEESHHSAISNTQEGTTVVQHGDENGTAESTVVRHVNDIGLIPIFPPSIRSSHVSKSSKSSKSSKVTTRTKPQRSNTITTMDAVRIPNPIAIARARSHHSSSKPKASTAVGRALQAFNRLPWVANPTVTPGSFIPEEHPARVTKDFIPTRSARAKLRERQAGRGAVYTKNGISEGDVEASESWYQPNARQLQRAMRTQHQSQTHALAASAAKLNIAQGGAVQQAYASYRAVSGRPLGYMYASPPQSASHAGGSVYSAAQQVGGRPRSGGSALHGRTGASISAAASAYLTRSASASQASSPSALRSGYAVIEKTKGPPPVPAKSGFPQAQQQPSYPTTYPALSSTGHAPAQPVQYYTYNFAYPQNQPYAYAQNHVPGSSPPLPPLPPASYSLSYAPTASSVPTIPTVVSSSTTATPAMSSSTHTHSQAHRRSASSSSGSATSGYGSVQVQGPVRYADYVYSYQPTR